MSLATNNNNNYGKQNMGSEEWAPSSRVLSQPGGASTISFGDYVPSPQSKPKRDMSRPRIVGGKVVLPESDKEAAAAAYNKQFSAAVPATIMNPEPAKGNFNSHTSSGAILSHPSNSPAISKHKHELPKEHPSMARNYIGNEELLDKLRESDFESKEHGDINELRAQPHHDYNEKHMADTAATKPILSESSPNIEKAAPAPEMRGCEGYTPNLAGWADGGLQSSSTELKGPQYGAKPSTRLHAPPGGASSIVFG